MAFATCSLNRNFPLRFTATSQSPKTLSASFPEQTSMKEQINKLKINGNIYFWKYLENSRNYPGWNFTVNKIGGENLLELIRLMRTCEWSSKKSIQITEPSQKQLKVPNNSNGKAKWQK